MKPCFVTSSRFVIRLLPFIVLLQNEQTILAKNGENLISAQPPMSAHLEQAPTLKVQKFNKRPGRFNNRINTADSTLDSHTNIVISHSAAYSSRWLPRR